MIIRYFNTVRHLKVSQIVNRVTRQFTTPRIPSDSAEVVRRPVRPFAGPIPPIGCRVEGSRFTFLNDTRCLEQSGWDAADTPKLWRYNLHYMDYLSLMERQQAFEFVSRWQYENPPAVGTAWEPYPLSLRIVNWCKWTLIGAELSPEAIRALDLQATVLSQRIEWHLRGNHLFANAKALLFASVVLDSPRSEHWFNQAYNILREELQEQFLPSGLHFEMSPMYHAIMVHDVLDMINVLQAYDVHEPDLQRELTAIALKGVRAVKGISHPDGLPSFMNDSAVGIAPDVDQLEKYIARIGLSDVNSESESDEYEMYDGYLRLRSPEASAILDCARVGPDYIPGHAHADTLSFELSVGTERVIVNSGTSTYEKNDERARQRGTSAHSTVAINGGDSSEVWGGFRVARRARPVELEIERTDSGVTVGCTHDGYWWLKGKPRHRRKWEWRRGIMNICDMIDGEYESATARYHFSPDVNVVQDTENQWALTTRSGKKLLLKVTTGGANLVESTYHREFGLSIPSCCLDVQLQDGKAEVTVSWIN